MDTRYVYSSGQQGVMNHLPPPPPRQAIGSTVPLYNTFPPPPPGPPPSNNAAMQPMNQQDRPMYSHVAHVSQLSPAFQSHPLIRNRQPNTFHNPTQMQSMSLAVQPNNTSYGSHNLSSIASGTSWSMQEAHTQTVEPPLTSATYIPGGDSFGPGVGIPGLGTTGDLDYDSEPSIPDTGRLKSPAIGTGASDRAAPSLVEPPPIYEDPNSSEGGSLMHLSRKPSNSAAKKRLGLMDFETSPGAASTSLGSASSRGWPQWWSTDNMVRWLRDNGFSREWQDTFRSLDLAYDQFLELGSGSVSKAGKSRHGLMHNIVYPVLKQKYESGDSVWDREREHAEGKRLRKLLSRLNTIDQGESLLRLGKESVREQEKGPDQLSQSFGRVGSSNNEESKKLMDHFGYPASAISEKPPRSLHDPYHEAIKEVHNDSHTLARNKDLLELRGTSHRLPSPRHSPALPSGPLMTTGKAVPDHMKSTSVDSVGSDHYPSSISTPVDAGGPSEDARKLLHSPRPPSGDAGREPSRFFGLWPKRRKDESPHNYREEDYSDSPTSPIASRHPYLTTSLARGEREYSSPSSAARGTAESLVMQYALVTIDGENFILMTIPLDPYRCRQTICNHPRFIRARNIEMFKTEFGQLQHDENLTESSLAKYCRSCGDAGDIPKIFVSAEFPQDVREQAESERQSSRNQRSFNPSSHESKENASSLSRHDRMTSIDLVKERVDNITPTSGETQLSEADREAFLAAAVAEYRKQVERKSKAYLESRREQLGKSRVIDFDRPREAPDESRNEILVPHRKAPPAPTASNTLSKANSLVKRASERRPQDRQMTISEESSIGHPLETHQQTTSSSSEVGGYTERSKQFARNNSSRQSARPSKSAHPRPINGEKSSADRPLLKTLERVSHVKAYEHVDMSPSRQSSVSSRRSFGPVLAFRESEVQFNKRPESTVDLQYSDEDSDDGLFAKPLAKTNKPLPKPPSAIGSRESDPMRAHATSSKSLPHSDLSSDDPVQVSTKSAREDGRSGLVGGLRIPPSSTFEESTLNRRKSLIERDDVWANRPPLAALLEDLDAYFPNVDLDQPVVEQGTVTSPVSSPGTEDDQQKWLDTEPGMSISAKEARPGSTIRQIIPEEDEEDHGASDTMDSEESTLRSIAQSNAHLARHSMRMQGLNRMKSIRQVAKETNKGLRRQRSHAITVSNGPQSKMQRRKSTKMFGGSIIQVTAGRGSRLSLIDTVKRSVPTENQNEFHILRGQLIGKGTYGKVYIGMNYTNTEDFQVLAIKQVEINPKTVGGDQEKMKELLASLDREIDTMQHLEHPNIVQYLGCERKEYSISIFLEYISGGSIGSCLRKFGRFEEEVVKSLTRQVLDGLSYLHAQSILHRDLKADNILLDVDGTCKISDFGISKRSDDIYGNDITNSMQGSVFWMAPEVIRSQGQGYSAKVDIWSLGCVVLEMFAGRRPWSKEEAIGAIYKLGSLNEPPPIPEDVSSRISAIAVGFMWDCFTIDPGDRPTAETLKNNHPFCQVNEYYSFMDTVLHRSLKGIKEFQ